MGTPPTDLANARVNIEAKPRPIRRLLGSGVNNGLAVGQAFTNTAILYEIIPIFGQSVVTMRIKTHGAGGTLAPLFAGPDVKPAQGDPTFANLTGTIYSTGNPATVAVVADTEAIAQFVVDGESYLIVKFTGSGPGTITYVDMAFQDRPILAGGTGPSGATPIAPSQGTLTDRSGTITLGGTSQQVAPANSNRKYFMFENVSDTDMWINFTTAATAAEPSILVKAGGGAFFMESSFVSTEAINVICATTGKGFTSKEG